MVIMDPFYTDRLRELWRNIDQLHLSYLEMEESPEKLDHRIKLEGCIKEYLCIASHLQKFCFRETAEVLYRSAGGKRDFSVYKAATGWNAIQLYAGNLLSQPWRKEYRQIKTYCGFYKHQIEANLSGAEIMFEAMGYKHCGDGILVLDGPICPDRVTSVSKDCLIAYVECQIMKSIWEDVTSTYKITWLEVLDFRKSHVCSPEQSIRALVFQFNEKQFQAQNRDPYLNGRCQMNHLPVAQTIPPYIYGGYNSYGTYAPYHSVPVPYHPPVKAAYSNGYYCNGFAPPHPVYGYTVPTAQLIEVDHNNYDVVDRPKRELPSKKPEKEDFEDWDYVYRNLEKKGYSKDLGERGDLLKEPKKSKSTNLDEAMQNLTVQDRPMKIAEALEKYPEPEVRKERKHSQSSSYENLSDKKTRKSKITSRSLENAKSKKWECKACTFLNDFSKEICEMCSKSRVNVEQQIEVGGPQCSQCTLVNSRDMKACQACGASLKDSPTYI